MYFGWLQDSIWDLTNANWDVFRGFQYCLVTCIDSTVDVKSTTTARKIVEMEGSCDFLDSALIIGEGRTVDVAQRHNLFSHFDEIWLYRDRPVLGKPLRFSIVSPLRLDKDIPSRELLEWFETSGCVLGLGDGVGMNYVTTSEEIVRSLETRQREFD